MSRADELQRRRSWVGFPIGVFYKFVEDQGGYLAALVTYYGFLSLFPLLLLASTILGLVLQGDTSAQQHLLSSALAQFPVVGDQLHQPQGLGGGLAGLLVGGLGALYGGLGVALAVQNALNTAWAVPRNSRPNPLKVRGRGLLLLATTGLGVLATAALAAYGSGLGGLGPWTRVLTIVGSVLLTALSVGFAFHFGTARPLSPRDIAPGALTFAVLWELLQLYGASYVSGVVRNASATNGVFALVLGLLAFLYLTALLLVLCIELDVVRARRLWPRALLTPLTDDVELTDADERAYTGAAKAQRHKGFERIHVTFRK